MKILSILVLLMICHVSKEAYMKIDQIQWTQVVNEEFMGFEVEKNGNITTSVGIYTVRKMVKNVFVSIY